MKLRPRAFQASDGGWYLAYEDADGYHHRPSEYSPSPYDSRAAAEAAARLAPRVCDRCGEHNCICSVLAMDAGGAR